MTPDRRFARLAAGLLAILALRAPLAASAQEGSAPSSLEAPRQRATPEQLIRHLDETIATNDGTAIARAHQPVARASAKAPEHYALKLAAAKGYLARADLLRIERHVGEVDGETNSSYRAQQAEWGLKGQTLALEAVELAVDDAQRSEARRVAGECAVHRINGPIAGLRIGPVAKEQIEAALELDPNNPEAIRAQGLMYLHNPPINGGDLPLAVETFNKVAAMKDGDVPHALLAQTWLKRQRPERARLEANRALAFNPRNKLAALILAKLDKESGAAE